MKGELIAGRFELEHVLGRGGMSEVWRAHDRELDRPVAVKLCAPHADRARFEREARAAAELSHANVARVYDFGELGDRPYLVLEYLPGGTLDERLRAGEPLPDDETEAIARDVAAALAHAHARGVVHRDLKPSNVVFDAEGRAKLADFGIARAWGDTTITEPGTILGTVAYISPEQVAGKPTSPASDVYSYGALLFQLLTGRPPFPADEPIQAALQHQEEQAPRVQDVRPDAPPALARVADAALAKDPQARPRDGAALVAALEGQTSEETAVLARPESPRRDWRRRAALVGIAALAAAGVAAGLLVGGDEGAGTPETTQRAATTDRATGQTGTQPPPAETQPASPPPPPPASPTTEKTTSAATTTEPTTSSEPTTTTEPATTTEPETTEPATTSEPATTTQSSPTTSAEVTTTAGAGTTTDASGGGAGG